MIKVSIVSTDVEGFCQEISFSQKDANTADLGALLAKAVLSIWPPPERLTAIVADFVSLVLADSGPVSTIPERAAARRLIKCAREAHEVLAQANPHEEA